MRDKDLIILLAETLEAASAAAGWNYIVIQVNGPTQQGIPVDPAIFFEKLFDEPHGWPKADLVYDEPNDVFKEGSVQTYLSHFQLSALVIQDPSNTDLPTASDVVNYLKQYLQARPTVSKFMAQGINSFRVTQVRNPYFEDDRHRFEARPSFDIVLTHDRSVVFDVPAAHTVDGAIVAGVEGQGTFPVP